MAIDLNGKVCLITGSDEGVGFGLVRGFLKRGASVAAGVFKKEEWTNELPALAVSMDVSKDSEIKSAVAEVIGKFGRIDVLINNAGIYPRLAADKMTHAEWRRILDVNLDGAWRCCHEVIPHYKSSGSGVIINVGSIGLRLGMENLSHYHASKGGIVGLTRGLARDLGPCGIRANCVHLGAVQTETEKRLFPDQVSLQRDLDKKQCLPGRLTPQTVEPVFAFLASDDSADITGQCLTVDRGWSHD